MRVCESNRWPNLTENRTRRSRLGRPGDLRIPPDDKDEHEEVYLDEVEFSLLAPTHSLLGPVLELAFARVDCRESVAVSCLFDRLARPDAVIGDSGERWLALPLSSSGRLPPLSNDPCLDTEGSAGPLAAPRTACCE